MASVLRNRGAGSGGFSGVYAPAFVPGSSHASADYIPGYFCTPNGPVYGMYVPSIAQSIAQTAPLLPSPAAAAQPFDQLPPHWIPPPPPANPPAAASVSNTGESGNGDSSRSGHPAQGAGGEAQARAAAADQAQQLLARVVITDLIRIRPASFFRRVVSELIDLCVISLLLVLVLGDSMIELIDKMEELDPSSTSAHELEAALFKHADGFVSKHMALYYVVMFIYDVVMSKLLGGRTVGKLLCGLRVVQCPATNALPPTTRQVIVRAAVKTLEWAFGMLVLFSAMCGTGRCPHDRISHTHVVCVR